MEPLQVVILAGGLGTRLLPITKTAPKVLVPVLNRPFVFWQLDLLIDNGVGELLLCVGYKSGEVESVVGCSYRGIPIKYSYERNDKLFGTGGALKHAEDLLNASFGVIYGDSYLEIDYASVFEAHRCSRFPVMMTVWQNQNRLDRSNVALSKDETYVSRYEKTDKSSNCQYIDYGFSVFNRDIISSYLKQDTPAALSTLQYDLSKKNLLGAFKVNHRFYEIGSKYGLKDLEMHRLNRMAKE